MHRFARWLSLLLAFVIFAAPLAAMAEEPVPTATGMETSGGEEKGDAPEGGSPTEAPPTEQPPTEAPPTEAPPTEAPLTEQPPTEQPPTETPPTEATTEAPPTEQPPTEQPPTEQPPTEEPPTEQPPTEAPPTEAPPTETPSPEEQLLANDPQLGMLMMADMPLLMGALEAGELPRIIYIEFKDGFSGEVLSRRAVVEGGSSAAFPEIPENTVYTHTGWKLTAYGNTQSFAADAETASFEDLLPSVPADEFSPADSQTACAYVSIQSTYALIDPEHAPFVLEFRERDTEEGGARWREEDKMFVFADEPDRACNLPELYLPGSCWTLLSEDYDPIYALAADKLSVSYNELMALKQQYGLGFDLMFETQMNEAYSMTLSFWEKRPDAYWAFDSLGSVILHEGGPEKPLPLLPEREGYDAFWQAVDIEGGDWLKAQFEGTASLTYAQAVEIVGQQTVAEGYGRDEVSFCAYYVPALPQETQYKQLIYLNLMQGGLKVGQVIASPATPDMVLPITCPVPVGVLVTGWELPNGTVWPADKTTTYRELRDIAWQLGLTDSTNKDISMDVDVQVDYDPANPIAIYAIFGDEQDTELYAKRVMPGGSVAFPSGTREDWQVVYTLSGDGAPYFRKGTVPADTASMTYQELLNLVSIAGVRNYYGLPTIQIYFYAPTMEQIPTGSFENRTIDVVLDGGDWLYLKDSDGNYLGRFRDSVRLTQGETDPRTFWELWRVGGQLARGGYLFLGWYTSNGAKVLAAGADTITYSQAANYVKPDANNYARLVLTPKFKFDGVSRREPYEPIVKKLVFQDIALTGYEKTLTLEYGKTVIAPAPPPLSNTGYKFQYWVLGPEDDMQIIKAGSKITFNTLSTTLSKYGYMYESVIPLYAWYTYAGSIRWDEEQVDITFYGRFNRRLTTQTVSSLTSGKQLPLPEVTPPEGMVFNGWIVYGKEGTLRWYHDKTSYSFADVRPIAGDDYWVDAYALFGAEQVDNPTPAAKPTISVVDGAVLYDGARLYLGYGETMTLEAGPASLIEGRGADVLWDSSSSSLVALTDNNDGTATIKAGKKAGSVTIAATFGYATTEITLNIGKTPTSVSVPKTLSLLVNGTAKLTATVSPKDAKPADVTWTSSKPEIAAVMPNGTVDAIGVGIAVITARTLNGKTASCTVTVGRPASRVEMEYVFSPREYDVGGAVQLSAKAYPLNALQQFTWTSGSTKIAKVDANGLVTGVSSGRVTITATAKDGTGQRDSVELTFVRPVTGISSPASVHVFVGRRVAVKAYALPAAAHLDWELAGGGYYAQLTMNGEVIGLRPGETSLRFTARNGVTKVIPVTITVPVDFVTVMPDSPTVEIGKTLQLEANVSDAHYRDVRWSSNNTKVARVDANGLVTGVKAGTAVITATAKDGTGEKDSVTVTVYQGVTGIKLSAAQLALTPQRTATLNATLSPSKPKNTGIEWSSDKPNIATVANGVVTATGVRLSATRLVMKPTEIKTLTPMVSPSNATHKDVTWTSSDDGVATAVNGVVTAVAPGDAVITAETHNGKKATCAVKVVLATEDVQINGPSNEVEVKGKLQLTASALPADTLQEFTWTTSGSKYATVSQTGLVTGVKAGTVTITATSNHDKTKSKTFTVHVITGLSSIGLSVKSASLTPGQTLALKPLFSPSNPTYSGVTWGSSDWNVASVVNGVVVAKAPGEATITATADYNGKSATCVVSVSNPNTKESE